MQDVQENADIAFMRLALEEATLAEAQGEVPIGAVVVCGGQVVARAHNRRETDADPSAHAEFSALVAASQALGRWRLTGCTVYVTLEPCLMCAGLMVNARVDRCVFGAPDPKGGALGTLYDVSHDPRLNHEFEVTAGVLQQECADQLRAFFRRRRAEARAARTAQMAPTCGGACDAKATGTSIPPSRGPQADSAADTTMGKLAGLIARDPVVGRIACGQEAAWTNPLLQPAAEALPHLAEQFGLSRASIDDAEKRLARFAPFIAARFPETSAAGGVIESPLVEIPGMLRHLNAPASEGGEQARLPGRLLLKRDSDLAIAGSVKARGGIYEVLKHTEDLALEHGLLGGADDDYARLASDEARAFFGGYTVQVGSTGNLGMSIGIASAAVGFHAVVHMSADAKQWKKDLLRSHGVTVYEYEGDYGAAVAQGRAASDADHTSYFVDDENSRDLFCGYAVAARRLAARLPGPVDRDHPLFVYIPCGVGGAPGGITFGLKHEFGDDVHVFFVEPVQAPCMLLGMASGLHNGVCVQDVGLTGRTHADGLAVGRPSGFVGRVMEPLLSGALTVADGALFDYLRALDAAERVFIEPSSCAAFAGPARLMREPAMRAYLARQGLLDAMGESTERLHGATHIVWATGGALVPPDVRSQMLATHA